MDTEDQLDMPAEWAQHVHPRRGGKLFLPADVLAELDTGAVDFPATWQYSDYQNAVLDHPRTPVDFARQARSTDTGASADAVRLVLHMGNMLTGRPGWLGPIRHLVVTRGAVHAAEAMVLAADLVVPWGLPTESDLERGARPLVGLMNPAPQAWLQRLSGTDAHELTTLAGDWRESARYLRTALAAGAPEVYDEAVSALEALRRTATVRQRALASYLLPDRHDWVAADLADTPDHRSVAYDLLRASAGEPRSLAVMNCHCLSHFVGAYDALGHAVVPLIMRWWSYWRAFPEVRSDALDVLTRIPTEEAFRTLLANIDIPDVAKAARIVADRFPRRAARILAAARDDEFAGALYYRHRGINPDLFEGEERFPDAPEAAVPLLLSSPPWRRKAPTPVVIPPSPTAARPRMAWRPGEREDWSRDWWGDRTQEALEHLSAAETGTAPASFYIQGSAEVVRPLLARWQAETSWFYLQRPTVLVGKYELDALTPLLRLARRKPVIGAGLLMPYLAREVAELMAGWLVGSRQFRALATEWFARHGVDGAALLIPSALGPESPTSRTHAVALFSLDQDTVRAAADDLDCRDEIEKFLRRDPLDIVPGRIPTSPAWAEPTRLPQVLLADGRRALPSAPTTALLRMIAMSTLDAPYAGLAVVAESLDPTSLARWAWALFRLWEAQDRPSAQAWAMNAVGYFGDDAAADRLAPLIRSWPSEGAAARAKRGVDVLAAMDTPAALGHLSTLARNAKSGPLRAHAAAALDRVATARGLLPEQLDDLLAPDLDLPDEVKYQGSIYAVEVGPRNELVLRDGAGHDRTTLPPPLDEHQKTTASEWKARRRKANRLIIDQVARLEEAMVTSRSWSRSDFRDTVVAHPLLGRIALRLLWVVADRVAALDPLGDLVDQDGGLIETGEWVRLAHPATDDLGTWARWLSGHSPQPFAQVTRTTHRGSDPSEYWSRTVPAERLLGLTSRGWRWDATGAGAVRRRLLRPFGAEGQAVVELEPGVSAVKDPRNEPPQTIIDIAFQSARGELGLFTDLSRIARSELVRSLRSLDDGAADPME